MDEITDEVFYCLSANISSACKDEIPCKTEWSYTQNKTCTPEMISVPSKCEDLPKQRNRKVKRPYSPELIVSHKRMLDRKKGSLLPHWISSNIPATTDSKPFTCDLCKSPYIVNPTRSRLPYTKAKRKPVARKVVDPVLNKTLVVCNACGLAYGRNKTKKPKPERATPTEEDKTNYQKEAISFAKSLANSLQEPLFERLYCPTYKYKPCHCLQSYIMGNDESCNEVVSTARALQLLSLLKEAKLLSKKKDVPDHTEHDSVDAEDSTKKSKVPRGAKLRRNQVFENFVLTQRLYLRDELGFCERACQRVLVYSNNFLHKKGKSASNEGPRIEKTIGKNAAGALKPIEELANRSCCLDKCVMLASTHSKLLETWRKTASLGQRQARRVLAEMLTPTGGTKANCYKFISMVTGCSYTTINLVNEHMRRTQGDREPPEHGLKRRPPPFDVVNETGDSWSGLEIPSQEELRSMNSQQALARLQQQQDKLDRLKKQIADQQRLLEKQQMLLNDRTSPTQEDETRLVENVTSVLNSPQLLHILKLPTTSATAAVPIARQVMSPPTISVMTTSGNFEPLGNISNISVSLPENGSSRTTFSNVVIVPETSLDISNLGTRVCTESLVPAASYEVDVSSSPSVSQAASSSTYQLFAVMDSPSSTIFHFNN